MKVAAACVLLIVAGCAGRAQRVHRWPSNLTTGVVFLSVGVPSMAVGAGLFGYAAAHEPSRQQGPDMAIFVPGVTGFGLGIPFVTVGTILTVSGALNERDERRQRSRHFYGEPTEATAPQ